MTKLPRVPTLSIAILLLLSAATCTAADDLVKLIPHDAFGFVVVNNMADADAKVRQTAKQMQLPVPKTNLQALAGIKQGFDEKRAVGLAVVPGVDGSPMPVLYLPVTDYAAFVGQLADDGPDSAFKLMGRPVAISSKGGYAIIVPLDQEPALKRVVGAPRRIAPAVADLDEYLAEQDIAAVLTPSGVELLAATAQQGLAQLKQVLEANESTAAQAGFTDMYADFVKAISHESDRVALGVRIDDDGNLRVTKRVRFNPEGSVAPLLKDARPHRGDLLAGLPAEQFVMAIGGITPIEAYGPLMEFSAKLMKSQQQIYGIPPGKVDEVIELSKESVTQVEAMAFMLGIGQKDDPLYSNMVAVMRVKNSKKYLADYRKSIESMNAIAEDSEESLLGGMKVESVEIDGTAGLKLVMPLPIGQLGQDENVKAMMAKMYGADGKMTAYLAAIDKRTVALAYTTPGALKAVRQKIKQDGAGLTADAGVVETGKLLPKGAQWVGYWSASGTMAFANRMFVMMEEIVGEQVRAPEFPESPPIGFAALASPDGLESEMVVPAKLLDALGEYIVKMQQMQAEPESQEF